MKSILVLLAVLTSVNAQAGSFALFGGSYVAGNQSGASSSGGIVGGFDTKLDSMIGPLELSLIGDHVSYKVPGRDNSHITELMVAPGTSIDIGPLHVFGAIGLGAQLNVLQDAYASGSSVIDQDSPVFTWVVAPKIGADFKFSETHFVGLEAAYHYSQYTLKTNTIASGVSTPNSDQKVNQGFLTIAARFGWNF